MMCDTCEAPARPTAETGLAFIPKASLHIEDHWYLRLFMMTLSHIPLTGLPLTTLSQVRLRKRGTMPGLVGLTTYLLNEKHTNRKDSQTPGARNVVTFYSGLLSKLSSEAVQAVMAHELAHAWLNEHVGPEASGRREEDADILAEMWGFGPHLHALAEETEPFS